MNAVSLNLPTPISPAVLSQAVPAVNGFTDLINLLLASVPPEPESAAAVPIGVPDDSSTPALTVKSNATPDQIASALIRFMLKGKQGNEPKKNLPVKPEAVPVPVPSQHIFIPGRLNSAAAIVMAALQDAATTPTLELGQDKAVVSGPGGTGSRLAGPNVSGPAGDSGLKTGVFLNTNEAPPNLKGPVTFELQLTPVTDPRLADSQTAIKTSSPATQPILPANLVPAPADPPSTLKVQPAVPTDPQPPMKPDSAATLQSSSLIQPTSVQPTSVQPTNTQSTRLAPESSTKPVVPSAGPAPVTFSHQPSSGENSDDTGSQPKPREEQPAKVLAVAASALTDHSVPGNSFPGGFQAIAPVHATPTTVDSKNIEPSSTPLSASDLSDSPAKPLPPPGQMQQIEVRISQPQTPPVDLQIAQRAGQIQVVVRTGDANLETSLRQDLNTLVHSLERSGFHTETFVPVAATAGADSSRMNSQREPNQAPPDSSRHNQGQNSGHNGGRGSGENSRGRPSRDRHESEAWTNSWEEPS